MASSNNHRILSTGTALGFLPLALVQSARLRSDTLATPLSDGAPAGSVGDLTAPSMDLLVVGDSNAMGYGVADHYDTEVEYAMNRLSEAIGPALTIGLAAVIGFFALAIFLPMWDLTPMVK